MNEFVPLVIAILVQAVLGGVFLIGFVAVMRRVVDKEFPALLQVMNDKLTLMQQRLERMSGEFNAFSLRLENHIGSTEAKLESTGFRLTNLERMKDRNA